MKKTAVVICNYNKKEDVINCLRSVLEQDCLGSVDIYLVDNASSDGSVEALTESFPVINDGTVRLIVNSENLGGSGGFNTGLRAALDHGGYGYYMCVDNDAELDEKCISNLAVFLEAHEDFGMACAKVYDREQPGVIQQYGLFIDYNNFSTVSPNCGKTDEDNLPEFIECDTAPACALMVRAEVVDKIGILPEENFLYWDDTEWCAGCREAGYKIACVGNALAVHAMGAKKEAVTTFPTYYAWRNWLRYFMRHTPDKLRERMCIVMLSYLFEDIYSAFYQGDSPKIRTLTAAFDDALHGVTGKAAEGIIGPVAGDPVRFAKISRGRRSVNIISDGYSDVPYLVAKNILKAADHDMRIYIDGTGEDGDKLNGEPDINVKICSSIFKLDDLSNKYIYVDMNMCVLESEDDAYYVMNYGYGRETFISMYRDLMLRKMK